MSEAEMLAMGLPCSFTGDKVPSNPGKKRRKKGKQNSKNDDNTKKKAAYAYTAVRIPEARGEGEGGGQAAVPSSLAWVSATAQDSGKTYWYNPFTRISTWSMEKGLQPCQQEEEKEKVTCSSSCLAIGEKKEDEEEDEKKGKLTAMEEEPRVDECSQLLDSCDVSTIFSMAVMKASAGKFWGRRRVLFSRFSEGVAMDETGWYSVTPEPIAKHYADRLRANVIVDACCGVGGNAIQFAMTCERVIAIDIDPVRLLCARRNAQVYGVADRIEFILGDFTKILPGLQGIDVIFLAPPWGGTTYTDKVLFKLHDLGDAFGDALVKRSLQVCDHVMYLVPKHTDPADIVSLARNCRVPCELEKVSHRNSNTISMLAAYFGPEFASYAPDRVQYLE
jgi:predicted methyltransferase